MMSSPHASIATSVTPAVIEPVSLWLKPKTPTTRCVDGGRLR